MDDTLAENDIKGVFSTISTSTDRYKAIVESWKDAGHPESFDGIVDLLLQNGYTERQINEAFNLYESNDNSNEDVLIRRLYSHIIANDMVGDVKSMMELEFGYKNSPVRKVPVDTKFSFNKIKDIFRTVSEQSNEVQSRGKELNDLGRNRKKSTDLITSDQYISILREIEQLDDDINVVSLKNQVLASWRKGMHARTHYDDLLRKVDLSVNDIV